MYPFLYTHCLLSQTKSTQQQPTATSHQSGRPYCGGSVCLAYHFPFHPHRTSVYFAHSPVSPPIEAAPLQQQQQHQQNKKKKKIPDKQWRRFEFVRLNRIFNRNPIYRHIQSHTHSHSQFMLASKTMRIQMFA